MIALASASGCSGDIENTVEFRLASSSPKVGFVDMKSPSGQGDVYVQETALATEADIMDVEVRKTRTGLEIRVIFTPEKSDAMADLHDSHRNEKIAVFIHGKIALVSDVNSEFKEGVAVLNGGLTEERTLQIAQSMGHT